MDLLIVRTNKFDDDNHPVDNVTVRDKLAVVRQLDFVVLSMYEFKHSPHFNARVAFSYFPCSSINLTYVLSVSLNLHSFYRRLV